MYFDDYESNWKNSEIVTNFIDIYEAQRDAIEKEAAEIEQREFEEQSIKQASIDALAEQQYLNNYLRVKAEIEWIELKKEMNKLASNAAIQGNHRAAFMIESTIEDIERFNTNGADND